MTPAKEPSIGTRLTVDEVESTLGTLDDDREVGVTPPNERGAFRALYRRWSNGAEYVLLGRYKALDDGTFGPTRGAKHTAIHLGELRAVAAALLAAADSLEAEGRDVGPS